MKSKSTFITKTWMILAFSLFSVWATGQNQNVKLSNTWGKQGITLLNQNPQNLRMNFSVEDYVVTPITVDNEAMSAITMEGVMLQNSEGAPNLPAFSKFVAVPQGATVSVNIPNKRTEPVLGYSIAPAPRIPKDDDLGPLHYAKNPDIYNSNAFYPASPVIVSPVQKIRGLDVVLISISPFQYNPVTGELIVNRDMEIEVNFEGGTGQFGDNRLQSRWWEPIIHDAVINEASIPKYQAKTRSTRSIGCEYVIIIPNDNDFHAWADSIRIFRQRQGITTQIFTTDEIGGNTTSAIESFIDDAYNNWDIP
ncbi:MAG: C25 family peptidase propeptide domain-containing protein, partial [Bacteroidales bacterium]